MKQYRILILLISVLIMYSCTDDFVKVENPNQITVASFYKTQDDALMAVNACYDPLMAVFGMPLQFIFYGYSGYTIHERESLDKMTFSSDLDMSNTIYSYLYRGIYRCNLFFENVGNKSDIQFDDATIKDRYVAEAKFMRGMYNFYLGLLYGTPPILTKTLTTNFSGTNSKAGEIYAQALADFKEAEKNLPVSYGSDDIGRATQGAAQAMIGKIYLWTEDWDSSRVWFNKVIQSGTYSLVMPTGTDSVDYFSAFLSNFTSEPLNGYGGENNSESVFEVQFANDGSNWNLHLQGYGCSGSLLNKYFGLNPGSYNNLSAKLGAEKLFESPGPGTMANDPRRAATFFFIGDTLEFDQTKISDFYTAGTTYPTFASTPKTFWDPLAIRKYYFPQNYEPDGGMNSPNNWRVIRYSDVLLMFAEADYQANGGSISTEGLNAINQIRDRVGMPNYTLSDIGPDVFKSERLREFLYELNPTFHFIRWSQQSSKWVTNMTDYNPYFNIGKNELLPFPIDEIDFQDGSLSQNPGY